MAKGKSRRPPKKTSPTVSHAADRAAARSAGKDPEAVPMPAAMGSAPEGMSADAASVAVIERARREGAKAERDRARAESEKRRKAKRGRPTKYTEAIGARICTLIAEAKPLVKALEIVEEEGGPALDSSTIWRWLEAHPEFRTNYVRAREDQADVDADQIRVIIDRVSGRGVPEEERLDATAARVAIEAHKWLAGKRKPKVYGDKLELSANEDNPPFAGIEVYVVDPQQAASE